MEILEQLVQFLPLIMPIFLIDFGFKIYAFIDILQEDRRVKWDNKILWIVISIVINFGWILYFLFGRDD